ncbi:unnamed protein product [Ostreobium quekettii]|uniref:PWWP domain-containing protein n=1 Tax=Ostreobium quekettii TaxID=121088 RepID=A0A8S1J1T9_9CHLO|nr:unnamed protein product [Ostreobium quekettii]
MCLCHLLIRVDHEGREVARWQSQGWFHKCSAGTIASSSASISLVRMLQSTALVAMRRCWAKSVRWRHQALDISSSARYPSTPAVGTISLLSHLCPQVSPRSQARLHAQMSTGDCASLVGRASVYEVVWGKIKGHPWWPAQRISEAVATEHGLQPGKEHRGANETTTLMFFGGSQVARIPVKQMCSWKDGTSNGLHLRATKKKTFRDSIEQVVDFLRQNKAPKGWWCDAPKSTGKASTKCQRKKQGRGSRAPRCIQTRTKRVKMTPAAASKEQYVKVSDRAAQGTRQGVCVRGMNLATGNSRKEVAKRGSVPGSEEDEDDMMEILYGSMPEAQSQVHQSCDCDKKTSNMPQRGSQKPKKQVAADEIWTQSQSVEELGVAMGANATGQEIQEKKLAADKIEMAPPLAVQAPPMEKNIQRPCGALNCCEAQMKGGSGVKATGESERRNEGCQRQNSEEKSFKYNGNLSLQDVIEIARIMRDRSCARTFAGTCKEILGTCLSVGCTVEHKDPREVQKEIDEGQHDIPGE